MGRTFRGNEKEKLKEKYKNERDKRNKRRVTEDEQPRERPKTRESRRFYDDEFCLEFSEHGFSD